MNFLPGTFLWKYKMCLGTCGFKEHFFARHFLWTFWKCGWKEIFLPGNFCMEILKVSGIVRLQRTLFSRHFLWKKCLGKCGSEEHFFARHFFIAPKASAEGACIWKEVGYYGACMMGYCGACMMGYYGVWRMGYFGIWVIRATGNFIRSGDTFQGKWLL